jgi:alcohol dehydrogenase class IV
MNIEITSPYSIKVKPGGTLEVASQIREPGRMAVIVTGSHLRGTAVLAEFTKTVKAVGTETVLAPVVSGEPNTDMVDYLAEFCVAKSADTIIAIGGGSVLDVAKAAAVVATNGGICENYQLGKRPVTKPPLRQIAIPTTAGTGSETTRVAVITNDRLQMKKSLSHPWMTPEVVALDPQLLTSLPAYLTVTTGMDAFSHALESCVSRLSNPYTRAMGLAGVTELARGVPASVERPDDLDARAACLLGSSFAGLAMQAGLGASHSLAPALCLVGKMRHSEAIAAVLPHTIRKNEADSPGVYDAVKRAIGEIDLAGFVERACLLGGFRCSLKPFGLTEGDWPAVLESMNRYASHRKSNPCEVTDDYARELFLTAVGS